MAGDEYPAERVFEESQTLAERLYSLIGFPLFDGSMRLRVSGVLCSLSLEHWDAIRRLLASGLLPSAAVVHRSQFEALVRAIRALYVASDEYLLRLSSEALTPESEQSAKNVPQVSQMMAVLSAKAPSQAYEALSRFKMNSWNALNSYTHAGIHPLHRHEGGYPVALCMSVLANANGLAVVAGMQAAVLSGVQSLQRDILDLADGFQHCMPPKV